MSRLAHAVFAAPGFEAEKRALAGQIQIEARERARTVRVTKNVWGNYVGFIASRRVYEAGRQLDAVEWLSDQLNAGRQLSPASEITMAEVRAYRDMLATPSHYQLRNCARDVAALYRGYRPAAWCIDRTFNMEFIGDQQLDMLHEAFARSGDRDFMRCGLPQVY